MFSSINIVLICFTAIVIHFGTCAIDIPQPQPQPPSLTISAPGEPDYTDVLVKRVNDNLTLVCELRGDAGPRVYVWNYVGGGGDRSARPIQADTAAGSGAGSTLTMRALQVADSGHYMCSVPPFSVSKYILVQTRGPQQCARGAFWCGNHCVLSMYVCDGFRDCLHSEDEAPELCDLQPCSRPDKLNCSSGRCISETACCRARGPLCRQPSCCDEHPRFSRLEGPDLEYPPLSEDRHAPDDYGFIQSTIYTVTACALIFMIAVVLLVSAICKMHMKRAALRSYTRAHNHTSQHYSVHYAQAHRFPPCYEASRLLEQERNNPASPSHSPAPSPARQPLQCSTDCPPDASGPETAEPITEECGNTGFGLARLSAIFTSRYRQVPTQCLDVEMTDVRSASLQSSPTRNQTRTRLDNYRSPTYCDLNTDFIFTNPDTPNCGRDLNYMATPVEFYRRRTLRGNLDRVLDNLNRPRPLTLQLGRFQLSIPRLGRRPSLERRPDTPNIAELNIDELDFVRLNSNETYTLNGRTIRLLGANFENYPILNDTANRPPPYTEAMRYKLYGPPPEYLSRDGLNDRDTNLTSPNEQQARNNIEMPPNYEELASGINNNVTVNDNGNISNVNMSNSVTENAVNNNNSGLNNETSNSAIHNANIVTGTQVSTLNNVAGTRITSINNVGGNQASTRNSINNATDTQVTAINNTNNVTDTQTAVETNVSNGNEDVPLSNGMETLNSVIDNLPAIDSDINANDSDIRFAN